MAAISARYAAALTSSHQIATLAQVWSGGTATTLAVEDSTTVSVDRASLIRRNFSVVLTDPFVGTPQALVPSQASSLLAPYGNEITLSRGITYADGTVELLPLIVGGIADTSVDDSGGDLVLTLTGGDRGATCSRAGFTDVYSIAPGTNVGTAIQTLLGSLQTGLALVFSFAATTAVTPAAPVLYVPGDDPWAKACELAASIGFQLYFDPAGICTFVPVPDPHQTPAAWSYDEGAVNIATHVSRKLSRSQAPNYIIRDGQGSGIDPPIRGIAQDSNPLSPTFVGGRYGRQVDYQSSNLYTNQAQCQAAADADLLTALGTVEGIELQAMVDPSTEVDRVIEVTRARSGVVGARYVLDSFGIAFGTAGLIDVVGRRVA